MPLCQFTTKRGDVKDAGDVVKKVDHFAWLHFHIYCIVYVLHFAYLHKYFRFDYVCNARDPKNLPLLIAMEFRLPNENRKKTLCAFQKRSNNVAQSETNRFNGWRILPVSGVEKFCECNFIWILFWQFYWENQPLAELKWSRIDCRPILWEAFGIL